MARYKMSSIVANYGSLLYIEKGCCYDYMIYMDILFIWKQVFVVNIYGFRIKDDK